MHDWVLTYGGLTSQYIRDIPVLCVQEASDVIRGPIVLHHSYFKFDEALIYI